VTAVNTSLAEASAIAPRQRSAHLRLVQAAFCAAVPLIVWFSPLGLAPDAKTALAITSFMILAWMTEVMDFASAGLFGLLLFWASGVATRAVIFGGFIDPAPWYYMGAALIGAMTTKSGLPQHIASFVVARVGMSYSRLLLGLIVITFLLTFIVPAGVGRMVIMAPFCIGIINLFGVERGSNIGRGIFVIVTYATAIFDKMIIAGAAAITARGIIVRLGGVDITYSLWLFAFLPCAVVTILAGWRLTMWMFPPEVATLEHRRDDVREHFRPTVPWTWQSTKASVLIAVALGFWLTDSLHGIPAAMVALGAGLIALLPVVDVLNTEDFKRVPLLPFFFIAATLGMGAVLQSTGALALLTQTFLGWMEPLLSNRLIAIPVLYWTAFVYHFVTASEISMLATSLPVLMQFATTNHLDPVWIGLVWTLSAGVKLFAYQSVVLVVGYSYGYFGHTDLIKIGGLLTIVEFLALTASVLSYWPLLGL
jgi:solute carrier family 13 (sodium-dependent dicarboxylate transporter), member 2/3/5